MRHSPGLADQLLEAELPAAQSFPDPKLEPGMNPDDVNPTLNGFWSTHDSHTVRHIKVRRHGEFGVPKDSALPIPLDNLKAAQA